MYKIITKDTLGPNVTRFEVEAPRIARARQVGQFVMVRAKDTSERIPLTIADVNKDKGTISFIVQAVGKSTIEMSEMQQGDSFHDVAGPLGQPSEIKNYGTAVVIGGGLGTAVVYPQAVALKEAGNKVISIIGARNKDLIILQDLLQPVSSEVLITTNDGSAGIKGFVTTALQQLIDNPDVSVDAVYCAGPVVMMKAVADLTRDKNIPTIVSLNPIMVDGTGMCGGCRVTVGSKTLFACVDGPEFDGHKVNFPELLDRLTTYKNMEQSKLQEYLKNHKCRLQNN